MMRTAFVFNRHDQQKVQDLNTCRGRAGKLREELLCLTEPIPFGEQYLTAAAAKRRTMFNSSSLTSSSRCLVRAGRVQSAFSA